MDKFYKALKRIGGCLYSVNDYKSPIFSVEYRPHIRAFPLVPISKLFVFNDLDLAILFCIGMEYEIWECEVNNPTLADTRAYYEDELIPFWVGSLICLKTKPIVGTYFCDSLVIRKQIYCRWTESLKGDT